MLKDRANPLFDPPGEAAADLTEVQAPAVLRRPVAAAKRDIRDVRRARTAAEAIGPIDKKTEIYGFTKGQFSIIDIINHCLSFMRPDAQLQISTWTAANADISTVLNLVNSGAIGSARWIVDLTFNRRSPELAQRIRDVFGDDAIRVAKNHAKFMLLADSEWKIVIRTSMNLNFNPRFENFQLGHDPELWEFHNAILDEVWRKQSRTIQDNRVAYSIHQHFDADL